MRFHLKTYLILILILLVQLRDGSTLSGSAKRHQAGVPEPRSPGGRLPGGACIPPLLEGWKHKILLAGKYLNVIRECGIEVHQDQSHADNDDLYMDDERSVVSVFNLASVMIKIYIQWDSRFYKFVEDAYTHANRTLLQLLLKDQQLIPRLRSLKHYFFLSQSSFLTHLLDLSHTELRKSAKSASIVKLQSLLDLALNSDGGVVQGEDVMFREDVRVTMAGSGLYEWLLKVVSVSGVIIGDDGEPSADSGAHEETKKEKDDKKPMLGAEGYSLCYSILTLYFCSDRCPCSRL